MTLLSGTWTLARAGRRPRPGATVPVPCREGPSESESLHGPVVVLPRAAGPALGSTVTVTVTTETPDSDSPARRGIIPGACRTVRPRPGPDSLAAAAARQLPTAPRASCSDSARTRPGGGARPAGTDRYLVSS